MLVRSMLCLLGAGTAASWSAGLVARQPSQNGVGVTLAGVGGGIGLIILTENAGKRNDDVASVQPCVECKAVKVVDCSLCKGTGTDPFADLVAGVKEMSGDTPPPPPKPSDVDKVTVDDWDVGEKEVVMYSEILSSYPQKTTVKTCLRCAGRGVTVCDNCDGSGIQPRYLERYSADDFMD